MDSTRVVVNAQGSVIEQNDYYPFGTRHTNPDTAVSDNRYRFSGKEEQESLGLHFQDFGARMYDGMLGRWWSIDPLAEIDYPTSPYAYCKNNSVNAIDSDGQKTIFVNGYLGFGSPNGGRAYWNNSFRFKIS